MIRAEAGSGEAAAPGVASIRISRSLEWSDTDASGHWHHTAALRLVESAESALRERLGLGGTGYAGSMPRVRLEVDFRRPVRFGEWLDVDLWVAAVGVSSVTFAAQISCEGAVCAEVRVVAVLRGGDGQACPWSEADRQRWLTAGPQSHRA